MSNAFTRSFRRSVIGGVALAALMPAFAMAQDAPADEADATPAEEIVVTGTLVRGIAPPGASPIAVNSKAIEEIGATNVNQVLATVPQLSGAFGGLQQPQANAASVVVNRPSLRNLGSNTSGGSSTLILMDGHRLVGVGTASTTPDPDIIPPGVLERLEVVPDGGSAIYGSDAVAGVMNFITIKRFDGVKVDASYGFADDYYQWDANVTAGKDWGSGSIFASYSYAKTDQLLGIDRDYVREYRDDRGFTTLACGAGNIQNRANPAQVVGLPYGTGTTAPNQNCDISDYSTVFPASQRHSVFAGLTQELDDTLTFELRGYYTNRKTYIQNGPYRTSALVISSPFKPVGSYTQSTVYMQWGPNDARQSDIALETWGVTPTLTKDLGNNIRLRAMFNYGESTTKYTSTGINGTALGTAIAAGTLNPYNLTDPATPNAAALLAQITNWGTFGKGRQSLLNVKTTLDGDLFTLPGGTVKFATGFEYAKETFRSQNGDTVPGFEDSGFAASGIIAAQAPLQRFDLSRNVKSLFGEVVVPIFGADNATGGFRELTLSIAGRYDSYSDFGDTFNPRFGLTWKPVDWLSLRGAWGKSFNAPSLADDETAAPSPLVYLTGQAAQQFAPPAALQGGNPYPNYVNTKGIIAIQGNKPGITPQTATTWSLGADVQPPFVEGLRLGITYYNIDFRGLISVAPFENRNTLYANFPGIITTSDGSAAQNAALQALLDQAYLDKTTCRDATSTITCVAPDAATTYAFFDARRQNIGDVKTSGLDFYANYRTETGFGAVFANFAGTYVLSFKLRSSGQPTYVEQVNTNNTSRLRTRLTVGADIGNLTASATWTHRQGYDLLAPVGYNNPGLGFLQQSSVGAFNTIDLFFRYDLKGEGLAKDLALTLNVNNLLDQDPPVYIGGNQVAGRLGYDNGATLGRLFQFGISKKF